MAVDLFYVNGMPFYVSKTEKINFISVTKLKMRKITTIICCILRDKQKYQSRGFDISDIHADNKFSSKKLEEEILPTILHVYAKEEHVGFIENAIKTVKERVRTMCHAVPYRKFTKLMTKSVVEGAVDLLNAFPSKNSVSDVISPSAIIQGRDKIDLSRKRLEFRSYAMVFSKTKNNLNNRSIPAIALKASNNAGGFFFMSLYTGRRIHGYYWSKNQLIKKLWIGWKSLLS